MTSGEEARTSRRNSLRASLSPASAFSETALSSSGGLWHLLRVQASPLARLHSPLCLRCPPSTKWAITSTSAASENSSTRATRPSSLSSSALSRSRCALRLVLRSMSVSEQCGRTPPPRRIPSVPSRRRGCCVVVESAVPALECHVRVLLQSRGIRKNVVHTNLRRRIAVGSDTATKCHSLRPLPQPCAAGWPRRSGIRSLAVL